MPIGTYGRVEPVETQKESAEHGRLLERHTTIYDDFGKAVIFDRQFETFGTAAFAEYE